MKHFPAVWTAALLTIVGGASGLAGQSVELVSRIDPGQTSDTGASNLTQAFAPSISADGRYAVFGSGAANLVPGQQDANHLKESSGTDVFLQDLATGTTTLVSHSLGSPATAGNRPSEDAVISRDGRYVAFTSHATDLAPGQTEGFGYEQDEDLLLYDRVTGVNTLLAAAPRSTGWASLRDLTISADGRYVAFTSDLDFQSGQRYQGLQVHLCDRITKTVRLVSHTFASPTTGGDRDSLELSMSADGRYLTFVSSSSDLVPGQTSYWTGFLYDRVPGTLTSLGDAGGPVISADGRYVAFISGNAFLLDRATGETTRLGPATSSSNLFDSRPLAISDDGRFVAFLSNAEDLVPGQQARAHAGLFLYDRVARSYTLVSRRDGSPAIPGEAGSPAISADGRFVAFASSEPDLVTGQVQVSEFPQDVFLFELASGKVTLVSRSGSSPFTTGNAISYIPVISANGTRVVFISQAADLVEGLADRNRQHDVFAFETAEEKTVPVSVRAPEMPSLTAADASEAKALSADGRFVAFTSESPHVVAGQIDTNLKRDVFLHDRSTRSTILVSRSAGSLTRAAQGVSGQPVLNADGRFVVFFSNATDLVPGTSGSGRNYALFLFDRVAGTMTRIAQALFNPLFEDQPAQISPDGRWVVFTSYASNVITGQQDVEENGGTLDVFLWDRLTGSTSLVSRSTAGPTVTGGGDSRGAALSADGRFVAFVSWATNLVPGQIDENIDFDLFLFDRMTGSMTLVSHTPDSPLAASSIWEQGGFSMSANGRFLAFSAREDLDPSVPFQNQGLYLYDRLSDAHQWIANEVDEPAKISADGRWVVFLNGQTLLPGFQDGFGDQVYLYNRISKALSLVSKPAFATGRTSDGEAEALGISDDGRYVTFLSNATNLLAGQTADPKRDLKDLFLFDRLAGTMTLVSRSQNSPVTTLGYASDPVLSSSGRQVAFTSSRDLVAGDLNLQADAYVVSLDPQPPIPLPNCTLFDTRRRADRPILTSNIQRTVAIRGACGVPATATQVVVKVTALSASGKGNLQFYPGAVTATPSGILRFERNTTRTETFTLPLGTNGSLTILPLVANRGAVHAAVEVTGYSQ